MRSAQTTLLSLTLLVSALGCEGLLDRLDTRHERSESAAGANPESGLDDSDEGSTDPSTTSLGDYDRPSATTTFGGADDDTPVAPDMTVTLETRIFTLVVGGSASATAEFSWTTEGSDDATVVIQMKSSVTHPDWTPLLADLPSSDVGERYALPLVRQTMWFRAVATHPVAPEAPSISNIVRFD